MIGSGATLTELRRTRQEGFSAPREGIRPFGLLGIVAGPLSSGEGGTCRLSLQPQDVVLDLGGGQQLFEAVCQNDIQEALRIFRLEPKDAL